MDKEEKNINKTYDNNEILSNLQCFSDCIFPNDYEFVISSIQKLVCHTCPYNCYCNDNCITVTNYKDAMTIQFIIMSGISDEFLNKYIDSIDFKSKEYEIHCLGDAYQLLKNYYFEIFNYCKYSFDFDINPYLISTKDKLQKIINDNFKLTKDNKELLISLLYEIDNLQLINAINFILSHKFIIIDEV